MYSELAALQVLLEGVALPASKAELIEYAREQDGGRAVALLERLPDREYRRLDDVGEALAPVQPSSEDRDAVPHAESDLPPGRGDYVSAPHPNPGKVRDNTPPGNPPQKVIEQQSKTQNAQKERQEKML